MKNKNEKGFALVLSLVLLLAMSLMGGALIVISAVIILVIMLMMNTNKLFMWLKLLYWKVKKYY